MFTESILVSHYPIETRLTNKQSLILQHRNFLCNRSKLVNLNISISLLRKYQTKYTVYYINTCILPITPLGPLTPGSPVSPFTPKLTL